MTQHLLILFIALVLDRRIGDPDWLWRRLPHPVAGFGRAISLLEGMFNRAEEPPAARRRIGWLVIALLLLASFVAGVALQRVLQFVGPLGALVEILLVAVFLAQKSLAEHVERVAEALRSDGLAAGRRAVSMIVGRDPQRLDAAGVCRAAIESLAENFADGVVAPAFWYAVLGLPGLLAYKMLNTADSMIGHKNRRYLDFGRGAALLDDIANWPAARLSALLISSAAGVLIAPAAGRRAIGAALRDANLHRSPNAGWPEAAMAGALDLALAGPRAYGGVAVFEPMLNAAGRRSAQPADIRRALALFWHAATALALLVLLLAGLAAI